MDRELSFSLDLTRAIAAFSVFLAHISYTRYTGTYTDFFHQYGLSGVVMFFVLSGYVIAFVCENKHRDFRCYMTARFARLYYVLLFALLLTFFLDKLGRSLDPAIYSGIPDSPPFVGAMLNILFLSATGIFKTDSAVSAILLMSTAIAAIYLLSLFTESKVRQLRLMLDRIGRFSIRADAQA